MINPAKNVESQSSKEDGEKEAKESANQPLPQRKIIAPTKPPKSKPATQPTGNEPQRGSGRNEWRHPQVIVNAFLALITIGIGTIYYFQLQQMKISTDASKRAADAAASAAESAKLSAEVGSAGLRQNIDSIELARRNIELTQKNVELAQKNLDAVQQGLEYQGKANEISQTGLETANTPSLDVSVTGVGFENAVAIYAMNNAVEVKFSIRNHSDAAATKAFAQCFLENIPGKNGLFGIAGSSKKDFAVMPHETTDLRAKMFTEKGRVGAAVIDLVNNGKIGVKVYVSFITSLGKKRDFIETFYKSGSRFTSTNIEIDPPEKEISDLIAHSIKP